LIFTAKSYFTISFRIFVKQITSIYGGTALLFRNSVLLAIILHEMANYIAPLKDWQNLNERCKTTCHHVAYVSAPSFDACASTSPNALWRDKIS